MQAGKLNNRVAIDRPDTSQNETGEEIISWHHMGTVWCDIKPIVGREALLAAGTLAESDTVIRFRWEPRLAQMTPKWRLRRPNIIYNIQGIAEVEMDKKEIEVRCKSGLNEG